jgi:hypothetical protein
MLVLAAGCTESYRPDVSTETGNPPIIDADKVALVVTRDEVHVQGEPGAVTPPEGEIEVTILRNQELVRGPVQDDGSFDVEVDATLDDVFEVRAVNGDGSSGVIIVVRGGAMVGGGDGGFYELSCEQRGAIVDSIVDPLVASSSTSCTVDADCAVIEPQNSCTGGCGRAIVAASDAASIEEARVEANALWCGDDHASCATPDIACNRPRAPICEEGQCMDGGTLPAECDWCLPSELSWRVTGSGILPGLPSPSGFKLTGCNTLEITGFQGEQCTSTVPQCEAENDGATIAEVITLLENADILEAFERGGTIGYPEDMAGYTYALTLGEQMVTYRSCAGGSAGVLCEPSAFEELVELLERLPTTEQSCMMPNEIDCTSDFEVGDCDAAIPVYWHDPTSGACLSATYGGCGGNGNRYAEREACEAACPPPTSCPPNRILVEDACLACGLAGGCDVAGDYCALICTSNADCENEPGSLGWNALCEETQGLCLFAWGCE